MEFGSIFKAYDVRGVYPGEIDEAKVKRIAQAYAAFVQPKVVAVGRDVRLSGEKLQKAVIEGLSEAGVHVINIGPVPTDMLYFAVGFYHYDGGIQVSASHNPAEYNGLKMIKGGVEAISSETGLREIQALAESDQKFAAVVPGEVETKDVMEDYLDFLTKFVQFDKGGELQVVANNNFGLSGRVAKQLLERLNSSHIQLIELNFNPDGSFPKGRPDPLVPENRHETSEMVQETKADFAVAWDADGDRCYICDEKCEFVEGCHLTALLAGHLLEENPGEKVLYDPRNIWAVEETVEAAGGKALMNKAGHTFIKNRMKQEDALFAGEMSGHFYFRDFYYADNGLIPFLIFLNIVSEARRPVSELLKPLREKYFVSGEINFKVADKDAATRNVEQVFQGGERDTVDGLSLSFDSWRLNLRPSNTENLLRLNVEARDQKTCREKTAEISALLESFAQKSA